MENVGGFVGFVCVYKQDFPFFFSFFFFFNKRGREEESERRLGCGPLWEFEIWVGVNELRQ